jgi:hypothetical protein
MMLKHRVQANDLNVFLAKQLINAASLRQTVYNAAGAQHLKGVNRYYLAFQFCQGEWFCAIDPL